MDSEHTQPPQKYAGGLPRLDPSRYKGHTYIHWTMTLRRRATGWLDEDHHGALRTILAHALAREFLCCPAYCLMPDHGHFLVIGLDQVSQQCAAINWMRRRWNELLAPASLQHQPFDHVLREQERSREAFPRVATYILANPERAGLVENWQDWPYAGALFPGYPDLDPRKNHFWRNFWNYHHKHLRP